MSEQHTADQRPALNRRDLGASAATAFAIAVALPLLDLLRRNLEFFVVRGTPAVDYVVFAVGLGILAPLALVGLVFAAERLRAGAAVHHVIVFGLVSLLALQVLAAASFSLEMRGWLLLSLSAGAGAVVVWGIRASALTRQFFRVAVFLVPLPSLMFLFAAPVISIGEATSEIPAVEITRPTPIIFLVFDELPVTSILNSGGTVNGERFPNLLRLAERTVWFRDASTASASTVTALPSILTGEYPEESGDRLPITADHPHSLFTLVADTMPVRASEAVTSLCPEEVCEVVLESFGNRWSSLLSDLRVVLLHVLIPDRWTGRLPPIDAGWGSFGQDSGTASTIPIDDPLEGLKDQLRGDRGAPFDDFLQSIDPGLGPTVYFHHSLLPHRPWQYLPSGQSYPHIERVPGIGSGVWLDNEWLIDQAYQRHLLQVGYVDLLIGRLLDRLEELSLIDEAILVVTADHGVTFRPFTSVRQVSEETLGSIVAVPLFVSIPGMEGSVVDDPVELVDILPTIADLIGADTSAWHFDGHSLLNPRSDGTTRTVLAPDGFLDFTDLASRRESVLMELSDRVDVSGDWSTLFEAGTRPELIGLSIEQMDLGPPVGWEAMIDDYWRYETVDVDGSTVPVMVTGHVVADPLLEEPVDIAIVVNGTVSAVTRTFDQVVGSMFSALIRPRDLVDGLNRLDVYLVGSSEQPLRRLEVVGGGRR